VLQSYVLDALMRWIIGSQSTPIRIHGDIHQTVRAGIGHLENAEADPTVMDLQQPGMEANALYHAYLCEPLVVLNLSSIFARRPETRIQTWISNAARTARRGSSLGLMLEEALLVVLAQMFGGKLRALSDVFHTDQPRGSRKVTLVALKRRADGEMQCCPVSWTSGSSDRLGYKATSPDDVLNFLNNPNGKCFLFPDNHMGPDLSRYGDQGVDSARIAKQIVANPQSRGLPSCLRVC